MRLTATTRGMRRVKRFACVAAAATLFVLGHAPDTWAQG